MGNTSKVFSYLVLSGSILTFGLCGTAAAVTPATANPYFVSTDKLSYTGSVTVSGTLSNDGTYTIPSFTSGATTYTGRDGSVYMASGAPTALTGAGYENSNIFVTSWSYTTNATQGAYSGWGNPNNSNTGFVQLYDTAGASRTSSSGAWNTILNQFTLTSSGVNAPYDPYYSRLWPAPLVGGAGNLSPGTFQSYNLQLVADFANPATLESGNWYSTGEHPTNVTGTFTGVFLNESTTNPGLNGQYAFSFTFQNQNWAYDQGNALNGSFSPSYFAAAVPEPEIYAMMVAGLGLMGWVTRRRKSSDDLACA